MAIEMKSIKRSILVIIVGIFAVSCGQQTLYSEYKAIPISGWNADSVLSFTYNITDTITPCDVLLSIRHTQTYAYQNLWLFLNGLTPQQDSIEIYLADQRGVWLGNGWGNLREMPLLYMRNIVFPHSGEYTFTIQQGMREDILRGISDIGLIIQKTENNGEE